MTCAHRITGGEASYCFLQSCRASDDDPSMKDLVFQGARPEWPVRCDRDLIEICPYRERVIQDGGAGRLVPCPCCKRRHREGSTAKRLCVDWHRVKLVLKEMREMRHGQRKYFEQGTTLLPYPTDTPDLVRRLIWMRLKSAVIRRDRYTCQDCREVFGSSRRKVFDQSLKGGRGGYRWESLEVHHIVPRSRGGSDHPGNLKTLCPSCHRNYTNELIADIVEEKRRELDLVRMMRECDDDSDWEPFNED